MQQTDGDKQTCSGADNSVHLCVCICLHSHHTLILNAASLFTGSEYYDQISAAETMLRVSVVSSPFYVCLKTLNPPHVRSLSLIQFREGTRTQKHRKLISTSNLKP